MKGCLGAAVTSPARGALCHRADPGADASGSEPLGAERRLPRAPARRGV